MRVMRLCAYAVGMFIVAVLAGMLLRDDGMAQKIGRIEVSGRLPGVAADVPAARKDSLAPAAPVQEARKTDPPLSSAAPAVPAAEAGTAKKAVTASEQIVERIEVVIEKKSSPTLPAKTEEKKPLADSVKVLALAKAASPAARAEREAMEKAAVRAAGAGGEEKEEGRPAGEEKASGSSEGKPALETASGLEKKAAPAVAESGVPPAVKAVPAAEKKAVKPAAGAESLRAEKTAARAENRKTPRKAENVGSSLKVSAVDAALADARAGRLAPVEGGLVIEKPATRYDRVITSAKFAMKGSLIKLVLKGNAPMVGHYYVLEEPDRVVLDLAGNWHIELPKVPSNRLIAAVRVGQHEDKTRLVFDMKNTGRVALVPLNRNSLELRIK